MNILIAYTGKTGTTDRAVAELKKNLPGAKFINLKKGTPNLSEFDTVIVGGAIRMGQLPKEVRNFLAGNTGTLMEKRLGLFICCGIVDKTTETLEAVYSQELRDHATVVAGFGGEMNLDKIKGLDKVIAKMAIKQMAKDPNATKPTLNTEAIEKFAAEIRG